MSGEWPPAELLGDIDDDATLEGDEVAGALYQDLVDDLERPYTTGWTRPAVATADPDYATAWALLADAAEQAPAPPPADVLVAVVELAALAAGFDPATGTAGGSWFLGGPPKVDLDRVNPVLERIGLPPFRLVPEEVARARATAAAEARWAELFGDLFAERERQLNATRSWAEDYVAGSTGG